MKTNYLSALALIGLLAFSSCSKDDATTDNKTETPKSTIVLTQDQNVAATTNFAQNVNLVAEFDNLLQSTSLLKGMATTATGPEICGQKPAGVFNPTTASYDFKYDFGVFNYDYGGSDSCKLNDVVIKGKLTISVDLPTAKPNYLAIKIDDNGIGRKHSAQINANRTKHQSFATTAIETRIQLLNQTLPKPIEIIITDKVSKTDQAEGTLVELYIPTNY